MPGEIDKDYELPLSSVDRLRIRFKTKSRSGAPAELIEFAVVYRAMIDGRWRDLRRYDNAHGPPHVHLYDWSGETTNTTLGEYKHSSQVFNAAQKELKKDYKKIREWFIASKT